MARANKIKNRKCFRVASKLVFLSCFRIKHRSKVVTLVFFFFSHIYNDFCLYIFKYTCVWYNYHKQVHLKFKKQTHCLDANFF